jgi:hypothetical protein
VDPLERVGELVNLLANGMAHPGFIVSRVVGIEEVPEY